MVKNWIVDQFTVRDFMVYDFAGLWLRAWLISGWLQTCLFQKDIDHQRFKLKLGHVWGQAFVLDNLHSQILADQSILSQPGGADYACHITTGTPRFSDLLTALYLRGLKNQVYFTWYDFVCWTKLKFQAKTEFTVQINPGYMSNRFKSQKIWSQNVDTFLSVNQWVSLNIYRK